MSQHTTPAGWYHMQGDPANTHRWWDGVQWTSEVKAIAAQIEQPAFAAQVEQPAFAGEVAQPAFAGQIEQPAFVAQPEQPSVEIGSQLASDLESYWESLEEPDDPAKQFADLAGDAPEQDAVVGADGFPAAPPGSMAPSDAGPLTWMFLPFKKFAQFNGRSTRAEFWWFQLLQMVVVFGAMAGGVLFAETNETLSMAFMGAMFLYSVISMIPAWAVAVRRLHDTGRSGWFMFISAIPFIGGFWLLAIYLTPGNSGWNKYGDDPTRG